ncbi:helix-turn-helix domain-containing protein [Mycobacterium marseillense]|uniref:helix-turn-helix domain-containing protein n=1 Tax=Mycobacterium marseillense TaxID=701042 RepID=UPI0009F31E1E|nr:helix-turn-helix domain-containing protein [Mycobacterium marseillense]MCA2261979.1 helix-turn-helix domain-containing protein [Mycobacterium marseillense]
MAHPDELLSVREAAEMIGVKPGTLHAWRCFGRGPASYLRCGRLVYPRSAVEDYLARERQRTLRGEGIATA